MQCQVHVPQHTASTIVMPIQVLEQLTEPQLSVREWITSSAILMNDHLTKSMYMIDNFQ
jgi:hypothetical protein